MLCQQTLPRPRQALGSRPRCRVCEQASPHAMVSKRTRWSSASPCFCHTCECKEKESLRSARAAARGNAVLARPPAPWLLHRCQRTGAGRGRGGWWARAQTPLQECVHASPRSRTDVCTQSTRVCTVDGGAGDDPREHVLDLVLVGLVQRAWKLQGSRPAQTLR